MTAPRYNILTAIPRALYRREVYRDAALQWKGVGLIYLLVLIALACAPAMVRWQVIVSEFLATAPAQSTSATPEERKHPPLPALLQNIIGQAPDMTLHDGALTLPETAHPPVIIADPDTGKPLILIDTIGKAALQENPSAIALLSSHALTLRLGGQPYSLPWQELMERFDAPRGKDVVITQAMLTAWTEAGVAGLSGVPAGMYVGLVLTTFAALALRMVMFALIGHLVCRMLRRELSFRALMRMAALAATPVVLFSALELLSGKLIFAHGSLVYFLMQGAYMFFAVESVKKG